MIPRVRKPAGVGYRKLSSEELAIQQYLKDEENSTLHDIYYVIAILPEHAAVQLSDELDSLRSSKTRKQLNMFTQSRFKLIREYTEELLAKLDNVPFFKYTNFAKRRFPMLSWHFVSKFRP